MQSGPNAPPKNQQSVFEQGPVGQLKWKPQKPKQLHSRLVQPVVIVVQAPPT